MAKGYFETTLTGSIVICALRKDNAFKGESSSYYYLLCFSLVQLCQNLSSQSTVTCGTIN